MRPGLVYPLGALLGIVAAILGPVRVSGLLDKDDSGPLIAEIVRDRVAWPADVAVTKETTVRIVEGGASGFVVLQPGVVVSAESISQDGILRCIWQGQKLAVPEEDTDIFNRIVAPQILRAFTEEQEKRRWMRPDAVRL